MAIERVGTGTAGEFLEVYRHGGHTHIGLHSTAKKTSLSVTVSNEVGVAMAAAVLYAATDRDKEPDVTPG